MNDKNTNAHKHIKKIISTKSKLSRMSQMHLYFLFTSYNIWGFFYWITVTSLLSFHSKMFKSVLNFTVWWIELFRRGLSNVFLFMTLNILNVFPVSFFPHSIIYITWCMHRIWSVFFLCSWLSKKNTVNYTCVYLALLSGLISQQ